MSLRWFIFSAEEVKRKFIAELGNGGIIRNIQGLTKPAPRKEAETYELVSGIAVESLFAHRSLVVVLGAAHQDDHPCHCDEEHRLYAPHRRRRDAERPFGHGLVARDRGGARLRQAVIINDIVEAFNSLASEKLPEAKLKEFVGHTPLQVIAGILLGVANTFIMYYCVL